MQYMKLGEDATLEERHFNMVGYSKSEDGISGLLDVNDGKSKWR